MSDSSDDFDDYSDSDYEGPLIIPSESIIIEHTDIATCDGIISALVTDINKVMSFSEKIRKEQRIYWIRLTHTVCGEKSRDYIIKRVKAITGRDVRWILYNELEIDISRF